MIRLGFEVKGEISALKEPVEHVKLDKEQRKLTINKKVVVENIPEYAFEYTVGGDPPIGLLCEYLYKQTKKDTGILWDPNISVEEFISLTKKLATLSREALRIKE